MSMRGLTIFITGGSRGIGLAIAIKCAAEGANIAIAAKTTTEHPSLEGTIYTAAEQIKAAGGNALPIPWLISSFLYFKCANRVDWIEQRH